MRDEGWYVDGGGGRYGEYQWSQRLTITIWAVQGMIFMIEDDDDNGCSFEGIDNDVFDQ